MKKNASYLITGISLLICRIIISCGKPETARPGALAFSADSIKFDTLFTTVKSPTQRFRIYNRSNNRIKIDRISIRNGEQSEFRMLADGITGQSITNYELAAGDSMLLLFTLKSQQRNNTAEDRLIIESGSFREEIVLIAYVLDAWFLQNQIVYQDSIITAEKPLVIDGYLLVPEGVTLTIVPGAQLYFTSLRMPPYYETFASQLVVGGKLLVQGNVNQKVIFSSYRFDTDNYYSEGSGQWQGLRFLTTSQGSILTHAIIKNAAIGIQIDSSALSTTEPKVTLNKCEIRNMSNHGIFILGFDKNISTTTAPSILATNTLIYNIGQYAIGIFGGGYQRFVNCSFITGNPEYGTGKQTLALQNYLVYNDANGAEVTEFYPLFSQFINCIAWGFEKEEIGIDFKGALTKEVWFRNCLLKTERSDIPTTPDEQISGTIRGAANLLNLDPKFVKPSDRNYRLSAESPARGKGVSSWSDLSIPSEDLSETPRDFPPDIGALVFKP